MTQSEGKRESKALMGLELTIMAGGVIGWLAIIFCVCYLFGWAAFHLLIWIGDAVGRLAQ
jgi:uncharacterized MAPEG superfamily protein